MEEALVVYLLAGASLSALVAARAYWMHAPQLALKPYVILNRISGVRDYHLTAASGLVESRVQMDVYGLTYVSAKLVARAIESRLSGVQTSQGAVRFSGCFLSNERDGYEDDATPDKLFRTSLDFMIWHQ